jgi:hypothetical protein
LSKYFLLDGEAAIECESNHSILIESIFYILL